MTKEIKKWWNETSQGYQKDAKIPTKSAHYGLYSPDEDKLKLLGNIKGKKILEIGCGGGQCSIAFAKQGAHCIGIDISEEQLKFAKNLAKKEKVKVKFILGDFQNLNRIKSNSQDIVFSAFALHYSQNLDEVFKQVHRILKKNGLFVFSFDHPFYDTINSKNFKIEFSYFKTGKFVEWETWKNGSKHKFVMYKRKVSDIYDSLVKAKFFVERIIEPLKLNKDSWENKYYPIKLAKLIGPTIIFKTKKLK
jgi:ubiquinone/menaquinone biosynthesis C-methylase UbiE